MKTRIALVLVVLFVCAACSSYDAARVGMKMTELGSVFAVMGNGDKAIPKGHGDILITIALKTVREDPYLIKTMPTRPDDYAYPVVINVDGQGTEWRARCEPDKQERYVDGKRNPEGGEGLKCGLVGKVRLKAGAHLLYVALPEDKFEGEVGISLMDGETDNLELRPVYRRDRPFGPYFVHGIEHLDVVLNGQMIGPLVRPAHKLHAIPLELPYRG